MSNSGNAPTSKVFVLTGDPAWDGLILKVLAGAAAALTAVIVTWLNAHGFKDPNLNLLISGAVLSGFCTAAVAAWGFVMSKVNQARAVQAGISLTLSGRAVAQNGAVISQIGGDGAPPKPVSTVTASQIVKNFAPAPAEVPKQ